MQLQFFVIMFQNEFFFPSRPRPLLSSHSKKKKKKVLTKVSSCNVEPREIKTARSSHSPSSSLSPSLLSSGAPSLELHRKSSDQTIKRHSSMMPMPTTRSDNSKDSSQKSKAKLTSQANESEVTLASESALKKKEEAYDAPSPQKEASTKSQIAQIKEKALSNAPKEEIEPDVLAVFQQLDGYPLMEEAESAERNGEIGDAVAVESKAKKGWKYKENSILFLLVLCETQLYQEAANTMNESIKHVEINAHIKKQVREHISACERKAQILRRRFVTDQAKMEGRRQATSRRRSNDRKAPTEENLASTDERNDDPTRSSSVADRGRAVNGRRSMVLTKNVVGNPNASASVSVSRRNSVNPVSMNSARKLTDHKRTEPNETKLEDEKDNEQDKNKGLLSKQDEEFRARIEAEIIDQAPGVSFKDVQGLTGVKLVLYESVILPQLRPEIFTGLRSPTAGLLLFGPPGNGKTMIAKCVATECKATFFSISASSITSKFVGDAERIMRTLFSIAREKAPSIIFIDEIDSLLTTRGGQNEAESSRRLKTEFLIQFDGVHKACESEARMLVIGATNLPHQLDDAVLRRFSKRIMVPLPDEETKYSLLQSLMKKQSCELTPWEMKEVVSKTEGYSFSDLTLLCKDAAMGPVRELGADIMHTSQEDIPPISKRHFMKSLENVRPSVPEKSMMQYSEWNEKYGSQVRLHVSALPESMRPDVVEMPRTPLEKEKPKTNVQSLPSSKKSNKTKNSS
ncbi:proteasome-activating nucleotidase [Reticulomyxa filosa]|uniref:Proteasome-activating nucleotidase n=1 Tax=Reticulomyxa filosa TaxID=46433 RepID=X6N763_RETFI|nr:proteasome-activating nucleotidase [Reticulomyxa filosa]|eukprot:ETO21594.1 proteasome-activating nucleotidase [Reticulomyxa filosa]